MTSSSTVYVGITAASFTLSAVTIFTLCYFLWSFCLRRRIQSRAAHRRASNGMFLGAMTAPENVVEDWLEERGISKGRMEVLCPKKRFGDCERAEGVEEGCVVCLEELTGECWVRRLPCDHVFHSRCIEVWLAKANRCPVCNTDLALRDPEVKQYPWKRWLRRRRAPISMSFARSATETLRARRDADEDANADVEDAEDAEDCGSVTEGDKDREAVVEGEVDDMGKDGGEDGNEGRISEEIVAVDDGAMVHEVT